MLTPWALIPFIAFVSNLALVMYVLRMGLRTPVNRFFAFLTGCLAWWALLSAVYPMMLDASSYLFLVRIGAPVWIFIGPMVLHFVLIVLRDRPLLPDYPAYWLAYLPGVPLLFLRWFTPLIFTNDPVWDQWGYQQRPGALLLAYWVYVQGFSLVAIALLARGAWRAAPGPPRRLLVALTVGTVIPTVGGATTNVLLPIMGINVYFSAVGLTSVMALFFAVAIFRYRMLQPTLSQSATEILRRMSQPVLMLGPDATILEANEAAQFLTEQVSDDLVGSPIRTLLAGGDATWDALLDARDDEGQVSNLEMGWLASHGKVVPMLVSLTTLTGRDGACEGYMLMGTDYRDTKRAELALRESEELYRTLYDSSVQGVMLGSTSILKANPEACRIMGVELRDVIGTNPSEYWPELQPDGRRSTEVAAEKFEAAMAGVPQMFDFQHQRKDGSRVDCEMTMQSVSIGGLRELQVTMRDVTEQRRLQGAIDHVHQGTARAVGEAYFTTLVQRLAEWLNAYWVQVSEIVDEDGPRVRALAVWRGGRHEPPAEYEIANTPCADVVTHGFSMVRSHLGEQYLGENAAPLRHEGIESYVGIPLRDSDGRVLGTLCVFDRAPLTLSRGQLETVFTLFAERASAELMRLRGAALDREQAEHLRELQKMESIALLAGGVAHDFNNILVGVLGHASLARELLPPDAPAQKSLAIIEQSAERAAGLTTQLLAYARGGKHHTEPVDMAELVTDLLQMLGAVLPKSVDVEFAVHGDLPAVMADSSQMQQVIMNLCTNAGEAMGADGGTLAVQLHTEAGDGTCAGCARERKGPQIVLTIADSGCGMAAETQAQIFEPFYSTKAFGRGLGLAAVQGVVLNHGGCLHVESAPGEGSTFRLYLPADGARAVAAPPPAVERAQGGSETILLAEDEELVRQFATDILERLGYRVLVAASGDEAVALYRAHQDEVDLALLDMIMPGRSGLETLRVLRGITPGLKAILTSGYTEDQLPDYGKSPRPDAFLKKPYRSRVLADLIRQVLAAQPAPTSHA